jgi:hypothetical protein
LRVEGVGVNRASLKDCLFHPALFLALEALCRAGRVRNVVPRWARIYGS